MRLWKYIQRSLQRCTLPEWLSNKPATTTRRKTSGSAHAISGRIPNIGRWGTHASKLAAATLKTMKSSHGFIWAARSKPRLMMKLPPRRGSCLQSLAPHRNNRCGFAFVAPTCKDAPRDSITHHVLRSALLLDCGKGPSTEPVAKSIFALADGNFFWRGSRRRQRARIYPDDVERA